MQKSLHPNVVHVLSQLSLELDGLLHQAGAWLRHDKQIEDQGRCGKLYFMNDHFLPQLLARRGRIHPLKKHDIRERIQGPR